MTPVQDLSDEHLVARCRGGDSEAWAVLVERFSRYVYAICVRGFRLSPQDAEDVFQDVFAKTHERLGRLRDDAAIRPWIGQLTRRCCIDRLRSTREEGVGPDADVADPTDNLHDVEQAFDVQQALKRARGALPRASRPLLRPRSELPDDRCRARPCRRHDCEPHFTLPGEIEASVGRSRPPRPSCRRVIR